MKMMNRVAQNVLFYLFFLGGGIEMRSVSVANTGTQGNYANNLNDKNTVACSF